jgi:hypothetical protein
MISAGVLDIPPPGPTDHTIMTSDRCSIIYQYFFCPIGRVSTFAPSLVIVVDSFSHGCGRQRGLAVAWRSKYGLDAGRWHISWADCVKLGRFADEAVSADAEAAVICLSATIIQKRTE